MFKSYPESQTQSSADNHPKSTIGVQNASVNLTFQSDGSIKQKYDTALSIIEYNNIIYEMQQKNFFTFDLRKNFTFKQGSFNLEQTEYGDWQTKGKLPNTTEKLLQNNSSEMGDEAKKMAFQDLQTAKPVIIDSTMTEKLLDKSNDRRDKVSLQDMKKVPFSPVVSLVIHLGNSESASGSGILVGPSHVLTAAHNVIHEGKPVERITVLCGLSPETLNTCEASEALRLHVLNEFIPHYQNNPFTPLSKFDSALLVIDKPLGNRFGWLPMAVFGEESLKEMKDNQSTLRISGYPGESPTQMKTHAGALKDVDLSKNLETWEYGLDTTPGQSGSGIVLKLGLQNFVVGIHTRSHETCNGGFRLTEKYLRDLTLLINQTFEVIEEIIDDKSNSKKKFDWTKEFEFIEYNEKMKNLSIAQTKCLEILNTDFENVKVHEKLSLLFLKEINLDKAITSIETASEILQKKNDYMNLISLWRNYLSAFNDWQAVCFKNLEKENDISNSKRRSYLDADWYKFYESARKPLEKIHMKYLEIAVRGQISIWSTSNSERDKNSYDIIIKSANIVLGYTKTDFSFIYEEFIKNEGVSNLIEIAKSASGVSLYKLEKLIANKYIDLDQCDEAEKRWTKFMKDLRGWQNAVYLGESIHAFITLLPFYEEATIFEISLKKKAGTLSLDEDDYYSHELATYALFVNLNIAKFVEIYKNLGNSQEIAFKIARRFWKVDALSSIYRENGNLVIRGRRIVDLWEALNLPFNPIHPYLGCIISAGYDKENRDAFNLFYFVLNKDKDIKSVTIFAEKMATIIITSYENRYNTPTKKDEIGKKYKEMIENVAKICESKGEKKVAKSWNEKKDIKDYYKKILNKESNNDCNIF